MKELNVNQITSIVRVLKKKSEWQIVPERTIKRWLRKDKIIPSEVYLSQFSGIFYNSEYNIKYPLHKFIQKYHREVIIENDIIYDRPHFIITTNDRKEHRVNFYDSGDMLQWYNENILPHIKTIIV